MLKLWCTIGSDVPLAEDYVLATCDIRLLYIEPGVFGELRPKPAMPPAPKHTPILESATEILPKTIASAENDSPPLNLSYQQCHTVKDQDVSDTTDLTTPILEPGNVTPITNHELNTGDNVPDATGNNISESSKFYPESSNVFANALLSGALDHIPSEVNINTLLSTLLCIKQPVDNNEAEKETTDEDHDMIPEFSEFSRETLVMKECMVRLSTLSESVFK